MDQVKLSVVIPDYKDPLLHKTIDSLLDNSELGNQLEVIAVLDGCWSATQFRNDDRISVVHLGKNRGMRGAINAGVLVSKGKYIMRTDEHCMFGKGYDRILTETIEDNWIVTATRYFLDPVKWERMDIPPVQHERLDIINVSEDVRKFHGKPWIERDEKYKDMGISETEAMQGSMWVCSRKWWNECIKELDTENYGPLIQDSVEMTFKTWKAGGKLMLNKYTWFAHKHRSFPRTHNNGTSENPADYNKGYLYALQQWEEYYNNIVIPSRKDM